MRYRSTTIVCVSRNGEVAMAGDGQVSVGQTVMKHHARKVRRMGDGKVLGGFAGSAADGLTLFDRFETRLSEYGGQLKRAAVELAREWRMDKFLRRLEAMLLVADKETVLVLSGNGDVLEPDHGVAAIGSGGSYAMAAARALLAHTDMTAEEVARRSLEIASEICVYTNKEIVLESL
ncbi:MAG: ATP-dependent protease subunit HslV [Candidatus Eremiobacteraeota bacterium]|nr:ATP-dependent protease subunit HslV [Candidatus Eremiobacteraeota bacterium]